MKKSSHVQLALNLPFFGWIKVPQNPISGTRSVTICNVCVQKKYLDSAILIFIWLSLLLLQLEPGATMDASQEIVALGMCQFVGSFIGSMPVTASFGRSAIQAASGVKSPFAGCVTALIILCACAFLTPHFAYIPTSALSAVIISAMIFTIEVEILLPIWKSKSKSNFLFTYVSEIIISA